MKDIKNKVIVLAGGCGQLGSSFVSSIVACKGKVAIFDIAEKTGKQIQKKFGNRNILASPITYFSFLYFSVILVKVILKSCNPGSYSTVI